MSKYNPQHQLDYPERQFLSGPFNLLLVQSTQTSWHRNGLYQALSSIFGSTTAERLMIHYNIGTSMWNGGSTVFWYCHSDDPRDGFVGGDVFNIDLTTGYSLEDRYTTVHLLLQERYGVDAGKEPYPSLVGCHLVHLHPEKPVIIVSHPFDAILASHFLPDYNFLSLPEHNQLDLNSPGILPAMPTSQSILLLGNPHLSWKKDMEHLRSLVAHKGRSVYYLDQQTLLGYRGNVGHTIMRNHEIANIQFRNILFQQ